MGKVKPEISRKRGGLPSIFLKTGEQGGTLVSTRIFEDTVLFHGLSHSL
jgi:hypothetical protein